jgi:hypothetical protein
MSATLFPLSEEKPQKFSKDVAAHILGQGLTASDWRNVCQLNKDWKEVAHRLDVLSSVYICEGGYRNHKEQNLEGYKARIKEIRLWTDYLRGKLPNAWDVNYLSLYFDGGRHYPLISLEEVGIADMACGAPDGQINLWSIEGEKQLTLHVKDAIPLRLFALKIDEIPYLVAVCEAKGIDCKISIWNLSNHKLIAEQKLQATGPLIDTALWGREIIVLRENGEQTAVTALTLPNLEVRETNELNFVATRLHIGPSGAFIEQPFHGPVRNLQPFSPKDLEVKDSEPHKVLHSALVSFPDNDYLVTEEWFPENVIQIKKVGSQDPPATFRLTHMTGPARLVNAFGRVYADHEIVFALTSDGLVRAWDLTEPRADNGTNQLFYHPFLYSMNHPEARNSHFLPLPDGFAIPDAQGVPQVFKPFERHLPLKQSPNPLVLLFLFSATVGFGYLAWKYRPQLPQSHRP